MSHKILFSVAIAGQLFLLYQSGAAQAQSKQVVFEGRVSEHKWALKELNPELPSDWSGYEYLVIEWKASSPQRFFLWLYTADGPRRLVIQPFGQEVWMRSSMPLSYFRGRDKKGHDLASANNRPAKCFFMNIWGPFGKLNAVEELGVTMERPVGKPTLEIRSVQLAKEDPGSDFLEKLPVVDEFGQWNRYDWVGKIKNPEELKNQWAEEEEKLQGTDYDYCQYGGYKNTRAKASGFFRVEQIEGRWWFVDPDGHLFLSMGVNCMGNWNSTPCAGRENYYAALPPGDLMPAAPGMRPIERRFRPQGASFYTWNLYRRFGPDWPEKWLDQTVRRMDAWGLNSIGNWSDQRFCAAKRKPYTMTSRGWAMGANYLGMPDVYSEEFAKNVDQAASRLCTPVKDDPYLIGYFIGNEPPWPGRESDVVEMFLAGADSATQRELKAFLAEGDTPERRKQFVLGAFEKYLSTISAAMRKYDPNHLNLGIRFGGRVSDELARLGRLFDVNSINVYAYEPTKQVEHAYKLSGRPVLIGEFHIGTPGNGLGAGLVQARDQRERGVAYSYYVEQAAALPGFIGAHWFQWLDQPVTGRMDGENYNIGYIDVTDRPYWDFVEGVKATHKRLYDVHSGKTPPSSEKPKAQ
jgi:hypothetical protein